MEYSLCFLDDFLCEPEPDVEYLCRIISSRDPDRLGIWERAVKTKYKEMMPNMVTRMVQYACEKSKSLLLLRVVFLMMVSEEAAVVPIITGQLKRHTNDEIMSLLSVESRFQSQRTIKNKRRAALALLKLRYFEDHFLPFLKIAVDVLLNFSYYHDNITWAYVAFVGRAQMAWNSLSVSVCAVTIEYDKTKKKSMASAASAIKAKKTPKKPKAPGAAGTRKKKKKTQPKSAFIG